MLDSLYAIWCELGNLLGVLLAGALLVAVQEIRKRLQKQMETADKKLDAVTATVTEVARVTNGRLDDALKAGRIRYDALQPKTRDAWMQAAAAVADDGARAGALDAAIAQPRAFPLEAQSYDSILPTARYNRVLLL
jgi:hypothetical protein